MPGEWWKISRPSGDTTRVDLFDDIGADKSEPEFLKALQEIKTARIDLHVNSDGGSITAGLAIFNALKAHPADVTAWVDSIAASISSVIVQGADKIIMAPESLMMIHNGLAKVGGDADELRSVADSLEKMTNLIAGVYAEKTKKSVEEIRAAMDKETWFDADDAKAFGLCDEVSGVSTIENTVRAMSAIMRMHHLPERFTKSAERMVARHEQEHSVKQINCYMKDGKMCATINGEEMECVMPHSLHPIPTEPAKPSEDEKKAQAEKIRQDAIKGEREYRTAFDTIARTAGIMGEALAKFEKFYGRPIDDVKFLSESTIAGRAVALGEGGGDPDPTNDPAAKELAETVKELTNRWHSDRSLRRLMKCLTDDRDSDVYKARFGLWMRLELKRIADQKSPPQTEFDEDGNDPVSRIMRSQSNRFGSARAAK